MKNRSKWPIFRSDEWEYKGMKYPWYKFIKRGNDYDVEVAIQYTYAAQYIILTDEGEVDSILFCEPFFPNWRDYNNYLE